MESQMKHYHSHFALMEVYANIAGICDPTGLVFGLMPHPEAAYATFLHPDHTRSDVKEEILAESMQIFRNAVQYAQANL